MPRSKEKSSESAPSSQTVEPTTPIKRFYYRLTGTTEQDLPATCTGEINANNRDIATHVAINILHREILTKNIEVSTTPITYDDWISINEKLPKNETSIVAFNHLNDRSFIAYYINGFFLNEKENGIQVTHWKPLGIPANLPPID